MQDLSSSAQGKSLAVDRDQDGSNALWPCLLKMKAESLPRYWARKLLQHIHKGVGAVSASSEPGPCPIPRAQPGWVQGSPCTALRWSCQQHKSQTAGDRLTRDCQSLFWAQQGQSKQKWVKTGFLPPPPSFFLIFFNIYIYQPPPSPTPWTLLHLKSFTPQS